MKVFSEIQKMPKAFYILIIVGLIAPAAIILSYYTKAVSESEKNELLLAIILILLTETLAFWLLSSMKQHVEINKRGIYFKYPPFKRKTTFIAMESIQNYKVQEYNFPSYGYKIGMWNLFRVTPSITMMGLKKVIRIEYENGNTLLIGTRRPDDAIGTLEYYKKNKDEVF
jgi:hypothetical protein